MPLQRVPNALLGPDASVSDPFELLIDYLDWYRQAVMRKISGLSEERLRTLLDPLGWSPLGLVQHLGWVERRWMRWGFAAQDVVAYPYGGDAAEWAIAPDVSAEDVLSAYRDEVAWSQRLAVGRSFEERARVGGRFQPGEDVPSLGRILFHLLQEYARHVGHLDIARELIDGQTGE